MWRGGGRPGMSASAPFVWRCLSGSTIAPFPHPSHRTGHADFPASGSRTRSHAFAHATSHLYETFGLVEVREWIAAALASSGLVLEAQPPTQPHRCVAIERAIGLG